VGAVGKPNLTGQQRRAVETRDVSVALSAGAGCGKTHVLVERYLSHLAPGGDATHPAAALGGLIAITFTDRAAREMRDRVRRTCRERLQAARDEHEADAWLTLLRELEAARISTIHAFCAALLRAHAVEAGVDPRFDVLQGGPSETLFSELLDDQLREQLGSRSEDLLVLGVMFGLPRLRDMIQHLRRRRQDIDFDAWAQMIPEELVARWQRIEREQILPALRDELLNRPAVRTIRKIIGGFQPEHPELVKRFQALAAQFAALDAGGDLLAALDPLRENAQVKGVSNPNHWWSAETYEDFRKAAEKLRKQIDKLKERIGIDAKTALPSAAAGLALLRVAAPVIAAYEARKRELGVLDFDDLLRRARDLLRGPQGASLAKSIANHLVLLLVDEFQDTDPLQVELVKLLCGDGLARGKLFFVGDAKQSIYRFRGADPSVFRDLRADMPPAARLPLTKNFRSQPAILDFVNALFCERLGPEYEALEADRPPLSDEPHIEFLWATPPADSEEKPTAAALRRREADWIARRLAALFTAGDVPVRDKATRQVRPAQPGDAAILFRSLSDVQHYEAALRRYGIRYYLVGGSAFYAQQEVFDLLNLLRTLNAPHDEVSLAGVLRSPFFSLADETLFWLAQHEGGLEAGLFDERTVAALADAPQQRQARHASRTIAELRARKDRLPIADVIREALARTGYDALLTAEFLGERKLANLRKLIDQARTFDQSGIFTLADYIHELAQFVARQPDEPPAPIEPESSTVVRLMTIHQAKGLEFPLVVVPDLARNLGGLKGAVAFDLDLGPLVRATVRGKEAGPCGLDLYRLREHDEEAAEEARLLYVATTRAADHLILSAGLKDIGKPTGSWIALVAERYSLDSGELIGAIPAGYARPRVAVALAEPPVPAGKAHDDNRADLSKIAAAARDGAAEGRGEVPALVAAIPVDSSARRVYSFSRLAGEFRRIDLPASEDLPAEPIVAAGADGDATELGTLVHAVLAQVDFARPEDVAARCRRELGRRYATTTLDPVEAIDMIERFLRSPRAAELRAAPVVHRELEFLMAWPPAALSSGRMISGYIDCLYQDAAGRWHIVDFKTNRATAASVPTAAAAYEMQMGLYALAVEASLAGAQPASLVLHFLRPDAEHLFPWTPAARERTIALVDRALAAEA